MKKVLMAAIMGVSGLLVAAPDAQAQECRIRPSRTSSVYVQRNYRPSYSYGRTVTRSYHRPTSSVYRPDTLVHRAPRTYDHRHCGHCEPVQRRHWVSTTRYERVFSGFDFCGRPIYRTVAIPCGYWKTTTVYVCR